MVWLPIVDMEINVIDFKDLTRNKQKLLLIVPNKLRKFTMCLEHRTIRIRDFIYLNVFPINKT